MALHEAFMIAAVLGSMFGGCAISFFVGWWLADRMMQP